MAYDLTDATTLTGFINQNLPRRPWLFRKFFAPKLHDTTHRGTLGELYDYSRLTS